MLAARAVSSRHRFGFARAEVLAAQLSAVMLLAAGAWIIVESVARLREPIPVAGGGLVAIATLGLVVNAGSALVVHLSQGESLNMRASFAHLATDAVGSLSAIIAGVLILWLGAGADPKVVQRILGHASAAMTMDLYGHLIDQNLWDAAARIGGTSRAPKALGAGTDKAPGEELGL